ncbi:hypothetical protein BT69DRAFT_1278534 [Atractiella rhizophila]|nr:hypothetical protein BT69DRAFT_1278534 [Atractiella rhizophila]
MAATPSNNAPLSPSERQHQSGLERIRKFCRNQQCYNILPESFKLVVFDTTMKILDALLAMEINGVVSAPLWDGADGRFAGMFTLPDVIHLIQYYYQTLVEPEDSKEEVRKFRLGDFRGIEEKLGVPPPPTLSVHPDATLLEACLTLSRTHARRLPIIYEDVKTRSDAIISVLTQYRVLKFLAINCASDCAKLVRTIGELGIGVYVAKYQPGVGLPDRGLEPGEDPASLYHPLAVATYDTTVFDVVHMFSEFGISAVPIVDDEGHVVDLYETVDIIRLVKHDDYTLLDLTIRKAIERRDSTFPGVVTCTPNEPVASIMEHIKSNRVHRFVVIDKPNEKGRIPKLVGVVTLSDILSHLVGFEAEGLLQGVGELDWLLGSGFRGETGKVTQGAINQVLQKRKEEIEGHTSTEEGSRRGSES